ncbi:MAG: SHOCT domain-containing protein [Phycisphaerae bacterium]
MAENFNNILYIGAGLFAVALAGVGGFFLARYLKNWMRQDQTSENFSLHEIRQLRERGEITPAEFEALKGEILSTYRDGT